MNRRANKEKFWRAIAFLCLIVALEVACAVFARVRRFRHQEPPRPSPQSAPPVSIAVKPIASLAPSIAPSHPITVSAAVSAVCGLNPATADRYEARNDALRSIARERNLATNDVAALMSWLTSTDDPLHVERLAALKNDVMNLLRNQEPPPPGCRASPSATSSPQSSPSASSSPSSPRSCWRGRGHASFRIWGIANWVLAIGNTSSLAHWRHPYLPAASRASASATRQRRAPSRSASMLRVRIVVLPVPG